MVNELTCDLCSFIYETEHHNGVAELLEILGRYYYTITTSVIVLLHLVQPIHLNLEKHCLFSCLCAFLSVDVTKCEQE